LNNEGTFRIAFWGLFGAMVLMRCTFAFRVRRAGERLLPDRAAIRREGWVLFAMQLLALLFFISLVVYAFSPLRLRALALPLPGWLRWAGVVLGLASLGFWTWTHVALGPLWSAQLQLREGHRLVTSGPYARIRHPMYTAIFGWMAGLALVSANWALVVGVAGTIAFWAARVPREEQMMLEQFGDEYREYMKRTGRYFPR
jgi:protein-S-isoprenylcysteine O-methyltransferase Ste14